MTERQPPYRNEKYSIVFPSGQGIVGYPNDEEVTEALSAKADLDGPSFTGEVSLDAATIDVLRLRLKDGEKGFVLRSYGNGSSTIPGLYLWDAAGHVVGRLATTADDTSGDSTVTVHEDTDLPQPSAMPFTPRDMIEIWADYAPGLHLFLKGSTATLVTVGRLEDGDNTEVRLGLFSDSVNHAVFRDWGDGPSWFIRQEGTTTFYLTSPRGDVPFGPPTEVDNTGKTLAETARVAESLTAMLTPGEWKPLALGVGVTPNGVAQYRHNAGRIELRGEIKFTARSTYFGGAATMPPEARPEVEHVQPAAMREDGVAPRTGYVTVQVNGNLNFNPTGTVNRVSFGGIWWPEPGFVGPQTRPAPVDE